MINGHPGAAFTWWEDGYTQHIAQPDPPSPEEAKLFIVQAHEPHYIHVSVVLYARDAEHAKSRIIQALRDCMQDYDHERWSHRAQKATLLKKLEAGELEVTSELFPIEAISPVDWADR